MRPSPVTCRCICGRGKLGDLFAECWVEESSERQSRQGEGDDQGRHQRDESRSMTRMCRRDDGSMRKDRCLGRRIRFAEVLVFFHVCPNATGSSPWLGCRARNQSRLFRHAQTARDSRCDGARAILRLPARFHDRSASRSKSPARSKGGCAARSMQNDRLTCR